MHTWRTIIAGFIEVNMVKNVGHTHLELNRLCTVFNLVKLLVITVFYWETKTLLNNRLNRHQRLFQISETFLNPHSCPFLWNVVSNDQSAALNVTFTLKCGSNGVFSLCWFYFCRGWFWDATCANLWWSNIPACILYQPAAAMENTSQHRHVSYHFYLQLLLLLLLSPDQFFRGELQLSGQLSWSSQLEQIYR